MVAELYNTYRFLVIVEAVSVKYEAWTKILNIRVSVYLRVRLFAVLFITYWLRSACQCGSVAPSPWNVRDNYRSVILLNHILAFIII
jgi:hypothetical protein